MGIFLLAGIMCFMCKPIIYLTVYLIFSLEIFLKYEYYVLSGIAICQRIFVEFPNICFLSGILLYFEISPLSEVCTLRCISFID
jgi:hypothetical protein